MTARRKAALALLGAVALWSTPPLFVKFLMPAYDPFTQNFLRYACGMAVLLPVLTWQLRRDPAAGQRSAGTRWGLSGRQWLRLLAPMVPNVLYQMSWVFAMQWVYPALTAFLNKSSIVFAALMGFTLFPEERWLLRSRRFLGGLALTVLGTTGLALLRPDIHQLQINLAVGLVIFSALMWALYSVSVKRLAAEVGAIRSFTVIGSYTSLVLLLPALVWGDLGQCAHAPWQANVALVVSGVLCIGVAHPLYYFALKGIGVSVCSTVMLTSPLLTLALSRLLFGERLATAQIVSGLVLLAGGALTLFAREKFTPTELAKAAESAEA